MFNLCDFLYLTLLLSEQEEGLKFISWHDVLSLCLLSHVSFNRRITLVRIDGVVLLIVPGLYLSNKVEFHSSK